MLKKYSKSKLESPFEPGYWYIISKIIVNGVSVLIVSEAEQEIVDVSYRFTDIGVILKGSSIGSKNVSYTSEEFSSVFTIFRIFFVLFFQKIY